MIIKYSNFSSILTYFYCKKSIYYNRIYFDLKHFSFFFSKFKNVEEFFEEEKKEPLKEEPEKIEQVNNKDYNNPQRFNNYSSYENKNSRNDHRAALRGR